MSLGRAGQFALVVQNLAYVIYTSGSTGKPKGVMGTHRIGVGRLDWDMRSEDTSEVYAKKRASPLSTPFRELFMPLSRGQRLVLIADRDVKDPLALIRKLAENGVTRLLLVPSLMTAMLDVEPTLAARLPRLRYWQSEGEPLPSHLASLFRTRLPGMSLMNVYGTSECFDASRCDAAHGAVPPRHSIRPTHCECQSVCARSQSQSGSHWGEW